MQHLRNDRIEQAGLDGATRALHGIEQELLQFGVQHHDRHLRRGAVHGLENRGAEGDANASGQGIGVLILAALIGQSLGDRAHIAHGYPLLQEVVHHAGDSGQAHRPGNQVLHELGRVASELVEQLLHAVLADEPVRLILENMA